MWISEEMWMETKNVPEKPQSDADASSSSVSNASSGISIQPVVQESNEASLLFMDIMIWDVRYPDEKIRALTVPSEFAIETMYAVLNDIRSRGFRSADATTVKAEDQEAAKVRWTTDCAALVVNWNIETESIYGIGNLSSAVVPTRAKYEVKVDPNLMDLTFADIEKTQLYLAQTATAPAPSELPPLYESGGRVPGSAFAAYTPVTYTDMVTAYIPSPTPVKEEKSVTVITIKETKRKITFEEE